MKYRNTENAKSQDFDRRLEVSLFYAYTHLMETLFLGIMRDLHTAWQHVILVSFSREESLRLLFGITFHLS